MANTWPTPGSFTDQMIDRPAGLRASDLAKEFDLLTEEHLDYFVAIRIATRLGRAEEPDVEGVTYAVALEIFGFVLGDEWMDNHIGPPTGAPHPSDSRTFLRTDSLDESHSSIRHMRHVETLASCLYNLQHIPGFKHRVAELKRNDLESALGEMEGARFLSHPSLKLRFVVPTGKKGECYEAEITTLEERVICCEVKTKKEQTEFNQATVKNTIEHARKQLSKGKPGMILLHIPEGWATRDNQAPIEDEIKRKFRQSNRLVAIVVLWDEWRTNGGKHLTLRKYLPYLNTRSSLYAPDVEQVFQTLVGINNPQWIELQWFVRAKFDYLLEMVKQSMAAGSQSDTQENQEPPE